MKDPFGPEISDLVIDFDPETLARRPVRKDAVLERLRAEGRARPLRIAEGLPSTGGVLDPHAIDGVLLRSHLELQRLHEEFRVGAIVRALVAPMLDVARDATRERPIRVVDLGCGLGFVARWLSAFGELGDDVEILGVDYNQTLIGAAARLAADDGLRCRFTAANAFRLDVPAHVFVSTAVLHHFRGEDLVSVFRETERSGALAFVHVDTRPSWMAPIGSWVFHQGRMREPLAQWDGFWSAVRAHDASTLRAAARDGSPGFRTAMVDAAPGLAAVVRIFHAILGVRRDLAETMTRWYAPLGRRVEVTP